MTLETPVAVPCGNFLAALESAVAARAALLRGTQVVLVVDAFRSRISYHPSDLPKLTEEIGLLRAQYEACVKHGCDEFGNPKRPVMTRPLTFFFG